MADNELSNMNFWMVRAGTENELINSFHEDGLVAVGWAEVGDLSIHDSPGDIEHIIKDIYQDKNKRQVSGCAGQLFRFAHGIKPEDLVLTYDQSNRTYSIGEVTGPYRWDPARAPEGYPHVRNVTWMEKIHRDEFARLAKNTLGSSLTVFSINKIKEDIIQILFKSDSTAFRQEISARTSSI